MNLSFTKEFVTTGPPAIRKLSGLSRSYKDWIKSFGFHAIASEVGNCDENSSEHLLTMVIQAAVAQQTQQRSSKINSALLNGEVMTQIQPHTTAGAAVTATMHIPLTREQVWQQLTSYSRWTAFFPDITRSDVTATLSPQRKRITQGACKTFLLLSIAVEIQLQVDEIPHESIRFSMVDGGMSFRDFAAVLELKDLGNSTELSYTVQATPSIPVPGMFIEQAMKFDLPNNMRHLRKVLLQG